MRILTGARSFACSNSLSEISRAACLASTSSDPAPAENFCFGRSTTGAGSHFSATPRRIHFSKRAVYVVDDDGRMEGAVPLMRILALLDTSLGERGRSAFDVEEYSERLEEPVGRHVTRPAAVQLGDSLRVALRRMADSGQEDLAVVDEKGALLGELNGHEVLSLALSAVPPGTDRHRRQPPVEAPPRRRPLHRQAVARVPRRSRRSVRSRTAPRQR